MELLHDATVWVLISFIIFLVVALRPLKVMILGKLDTRIADIRKEIETAESLRVEAQELLAQYQRKQREAQKEAESIIKTAKDHADHIKKEADSELKDTMKRREQQLADRLKRMEQAAIAEIRAHAAQIAVQATQEIIAEKLDKKADTALINASIKNIAGQLK